MPKVRGLVKAPNYKAMTKNIEKAMIDKEIRDVARLSEAMCLPYSTVYSKLYRSPASVKISDLVLFSNTLGVPIEELIAGVQG